MSAPVTEETGESVPAQDTAQDTAEDTAAQRDRRRLVLAALLVLLLAAAAGAAGWKVRSDALLDEARREASADGRAAVVDVLSYDHKTLEADLARATSHLSPDFAREFGTVAAQSVKPVAVKDQVVTSATVPAVSVVSASEDSVKLLMFVDQLTSSAKEKNVVNLSRLSVTMTRSPSSPDTWLVEDLRAI